MKYTSEITTRFCETDLMGHISNVSYFMYCEVARVHFLTGLNISQVGESWNFIMASIKCDFVKQLYANRKVQIETRVKRIGTKSVTLVHKLLNEEGELAASVEEVLVGFERETQTTRVLSESEKKKLRVYQIEE